MLHKQLLIPITMILGLSIAAPAMASSHAAYVHSYKSLFPNPYIGINLGGTHTYGSYAREAPPMAWNSAISTANRDNFAAGVFIGTDFTEVFAAELGYNYLFGPRVDDSVSPPLSSTTTGSHHVHSQVYDLLAKINIPVNPHFNFYLKGGPALVQQSGVSDAGVVLIGRESHLVPEAGIGFALWSLENSKVQLGYNHLFGTKYIPDTGYLYVSAAYSFNI